MTSRTSRLLGTWIELAIQLMAVVGLGAVLLGLVRLGQYIF